MTAAARPHRHRTFLAYAVAPVALVTLGACTGSDPGPAVTTPLTSSAVTSSPTPTASTSTAPRPTATVDPVIAKIPAAARTETIEGAAAYTTFYFTQLNEAFKAADPAVLLNLSSPACKMCAALSNGVADVKKAGHHYGGDLTKVNYASTTEFSPKTRQVLVDLNQKAVPVLDGSGRRVDTTRSAKLALVATVEFDKRWIITRLQKATS